MSKTGETSGGSNSGGGFNIGMVGGILDATNALLSGLDIGGKKTAALDIESSIDNAVYSDSTIDPTANMINNLAGWGVKAAKDKILDEGNTWKSEAQTNAELMSDWDSINFRGKESWKRNFWEDASDVGKGALQGAMHGLSIGGFGGPGGALIGGVIGGAAGIATSLVSAFTRGSRVRQLNRATDRANTTKLNNFTNQASNISKNNMMKQMVNYSAFGGPINTHGGVFSNGIIQINKGASHEENPLGGVIMGIDPQGVPNLVEEGEVIFNNYVHSNRLKVPKKYMKQLGLRKKNYTFAEAVKEIQKESEERPNDPISKNTLNTNMDLLAYIQEEEKMKKEKRKNESLLEGNTYDWGGEIGKYAPLINSALQTAITAFSPIDYSNAERLDKFRRNLSTPKWTYINDKMTYEPLDPYYVTNMMNASAAAQRQSVLNNTLMPGQAVETLLASDANTIKSLGESYLAMKEANLKRKSEVARFNRETNAMNAEGLLKAAMAKQDRDRLAASLLGQEIQLRDAYESAKSAAISENMNNMANNLHSLYRQGVADKQLSDFLDSVYGKTVTPSNEDTIFDKSAIEAIKKQWSPFN